MSNFNNHDTIALHDLLATVVDGTVKGIKRASEILVELKKRGEHSAYARGAVLSQYENIASGKLTALAAMTFANTPSIVERLIGLPAKVQDGIACGDPIPVADTDAFGSVVKTEKVVTRMTSRDLDLAFDGGKLRDVKEQERILRKDVSAVKPRQPNERILVDPSKSKLVFGNMKVGPEELREPLRKLGFRLVRIKPETDQEAA